MSVKYKHPVLVFGALRDSSTLPFEVHRAWKFSIQNHLNDFYFNLLSLMHTQYLFIILFNQSYLINTS